ncbi:MAG: hypothetical protein EHM45_04225 [Desulfobacteraceae bacterium]|nr:MAG: hypothetical protein EHM45_04225 [Desulfobacteraceae bacterium]
MSEQQLMAFYKEFLLEPFALELAVMQPCDIGCNYCFANLDGRRHKIAFSDMAEVLDVLANFKNGDSVEAQLLRLKYPVLMSNRVDPFGRRNRLSSIKILELFRDLDIRAGFQTKGFVNPEDFDTVMELIEPSWFYISIAFDPAHEFLCRKIEPGSISIRDRLALIPKLAERGHLVYVGVNPCVPDWIENPYAFLKQLKDSGVRGIFCSNLGLTRPQYNLMTATEKANLESLLQEIMGKRQAPQRHVDFLHYCIDSALELGLTVATGQIGISNEFWTPAMELYPRLFPLTTEFVNLCYRDMRQGSRISQSYFVEFIERRTPPGMRGLIGRYIRDSNPTICLKYTEWSDEMSYKDLAKIIWDNPESTFHPINYRCFSLLGEREDDTIVEVPDAGGSPIMIFNPEGMGGKPWGEAPRYYLAEG